MKEFLKRHKTDLIILGAVLAVALAALVPFLAYRLSNRDGLIASIYRQGELIMRLDLEKEGEERTFEIEGTRSKMEIAVKKNAIKVAHSDCPSQYCVHMDYVSKPGLPIVCAYNGVSIILEGGDSSTVYVG
ncbi:MAG: NusG domain II-containing protein [Bacilli bacterium]|nr:NusG domain II-containing protein [Bacilli bacterium]